MTVLYIANISPIDCITNHCKINIHHLLVLSYRQFGSQGTSPADSARHIPKDKSCHRGRDHPNCDPRCDLL